MGRTSSRPGGVTVSLLPDCLASRLSSTLPEVEAVVKLVERRDGTLDEVAARLRPAAADEPDADHIQGALRWMRRRCRPVVAALVALAGLMPEKLAGHPPTLAGWCAALGTDNVLVALRDQADRHLASLPPPLGFGPRTMPRNKAARRLQQGTGADPPPRAT